MSSQNTPSTTTTEAEVECPICQDKITEPVTTDPCHHTFCTECLRTWLEGAAQPTCPMCRGCLKEMKKSLKRPREEDDDEQRQLAEYRRRTAQIMTADLERMRRNVEREMRRQLELEEDEEQRRAREILLAGSERRAAASIEAAIQAYENGDE
jgi:hypothetical protein